MSASLTAFLYLVAGVLFILALRGLSHPETSRRGNQLGMAGMAIAVLTTLFGAPPADLLGWAAPRRGARRRRRSRRRHRAAHPDDGDAAARRRLPLAGRPRRRARRRRGALRAAGLRHRRDRRHPRAGARRNVARRGDRRGHLHRLGHRLRQAQRQHVGQADHPAGAARREHRARRPAGRADRGADADGEPPRLLADRDRQPGARRADHRADRRRRHAGRHLDAEFLFRLGGGRHRLHARQHGADHHRRAGRLVRRHPLLHHVQGDEPLLHLRHPRRLRRRDAPARRRTSATAR